MLRKLMTAMVLVCGVAIGDGVCGHTTAEAASYKFYRPAINRYTIFYRAPGVAKWSQKVLDNPSPGTLQRVLTDLRKANYTVNVRYSRYIPYY